MSRVRPLVRRHDSPKLVTPLNDELLHVLALALGDEAVTVRRTPDGLLLDDGAASYHLGEVLREEHVNTDDATLAHVVDANVVKDLVRDGAGRITEVLFWTDATRTVRWRWYFYGRDANNRVSYITKSQYADGLIFERLRIDTVRDGNGRVTGTIYTHSFPPTLVARLPAPSQDVVAGVMVDVFEGAPAPAQSVLLRRTPGLDAWLMRPLVSSAITPSPGIEVRPVPPRALVSLNTAPTITGTLPSPTVSSGIVLAEELEEALSAPSVASSVAMCPELAETLSAPTVSASLTRG